jgi:hypothetical protein
VARFVLPAIGGGIAVLMAAHPASAAVSSVAVDPTTPASPTVGDTLTWDLNFAAGDTLSCAVSDGTSTVATTDCTPADATATTSTFSYAPASAGTYTLTVNATSTDTSTTPPTTTPSTASSSPVTVAAPAAPTLELSAADSSPSTGATPTYTAKGISANATALACTLTLRGVGAETCDVSTWTSGGTSQAISLTLPQPGQYTLTVTETVGGTPITSAPATYDLLPPTPQLSGSTASGTDAHPGYTVSGLDPHADALDCAVTQGSTPLPATACSVTYTPGDPGATVTLNLPAAGSYQLTVTVHSGGETATSAPQSYDLFGAPTVSGPKGGVTTPSSNSSPSYDVTGIAASATGVTCAVTDASNAPVANACSVTWKPGDTTAVVTLTLTTPGAYHLTVTATEGGQDYPSAPLTYDFQPTGAALAPALGTVNPSTNATATYSISSIAPTATAVDCTLTFGGSPVANGCTVHWTSGSSGSVDITAGPASGVYHLVVTVTAGGETGSSSVDYHFLAPATVSGPTNTTTPSTNPAPAYSIKDIDAAATAVTCTIAVGGGATGTCTVTWTGTGATTATIATSLPQAGQYTLAVHATVAGQTLDSTALTYDYQPGTASVTGPEAPVVSPSTAAGPIYDVSNIDSVATAVTCVVDDGTGPTSALCAVKWTKGTTSATVTLNLTKPGTYTLTVTVHVDVESADSTPVTYVLLPVAPTVTGPTNGVVSPSTIKNPSYSVTGIDSHASGVTCTLYDSLGNPVPGGCASGWTSGTSSVLTLTVPQPGTYTFTVTVTSGGQTATTAPITYVLLPATPTVTPKNPASSPSTVTKPTFDVTGIDANASAVTCTLFDSLGNQISGGCASGWTSGTSSVLTLTVPQPGTYTFTVTVTSGGQTATTAPITYVLLPVTPTVTAKNPASSPSTVTQPTFDVTNVDRFASSLTCTLLDSNGQTVNQGCTTNWASGATSVVLTLKVPQPGTYTFTVTVTSGGQTATTTAITYVLLPVAPTVTPKNPASSPSTVTQPTFDVTNVDQFASAVACTLLDASAKPVGSCVTNWTKGATAVVATLTVPQPGTYTFTVTVTSGGQTATTGPTTYVLLPVAPTVKPSATLVTPSTDGSPSYDISGIDAFASGVTCTATGSAGAVANGCTATWSGSTGTATLTLVKPGTYTVTVTVTSGGQTATSSPLTYVLLPVTPSVAPKAPAASPSTVTSPTFDVTKIDPYASSVTCTLYDSTGTTVLNGCASGWTFGTGATSSVLTLTVPRPGTYTFTVTVTSGGQTATTSPITYVLLPVAPTVKLQTGVSSPSTNGAPTYDLSNIDKFASSVTCTLLDQAGNTVSNGCDTGWTGTGATASVLTLTVPQPGTYTFTVTVTSGGQTATTAAIIYVLLPVAPTVKPSATLVTPSTDSSPSYDVTGIDKFASDVTCDVRAGGQSVANACQVGWKSGLVTATVTLTLPQPGKYTLTVTVTSGGQTATSVAQVYDLLPVTPTITGPNAGVVSPSTTNNPTYDIGAIDKFASGVTCAVTGSTGPVANGCTVTWTSPNATATLTLNLPRPGTYTFTVTVTSGGETATSVVTTYALLPVAPSVSGPTGGSTPSTSPTPSFSVTGIDPTATKVDCVVSDGTNTVANGCTVTWSGTGSTTATVKLSLPTAGIYSLTVTVTAGGLTSAASSAVAYTLLPAAPTLAGPKSPDVSPGTGRAPVFTISGIDPAASKVDCIVTSNGKPVAGACTVTFAGGGASTATVTLNLAGATYGVYGLTVTVTANGQTSPASTEVDYTLIPPPPVVASPQSPDTARTVTFGVSGIDPAATVLGCSVTGPDGKPVNACTVSWTAGNPTGSVQLALSGLPNGTYLVSVTVTANGQTSAAATGSYRMIPPAPIVNPPAKSANSDRSPVFSVSGLDPDGSQITCTVTGPAGTGALACAVTWTPGAATATIGLNLAGLPDGRYTISVTVTADGQVSPAGTASYMLIPPPPSVVTSPVTPDNNRQPSWTVTDALAGVSYRCSAVGPSVVQVSCAGGTVVLDLASADDGIYTVQVLAVDGVGNTSDPTIPLVLSFTLDTTAPPAPKVSVTPSPSKSRTPTWTVSGIDTPNVEVCSIIGPTGATVATPVCGSTVTVDLTGQPDGSYTLKVQSKDPVGNISTAVTATFVLDTTPPVPPTIQGPSTGNTHTPIFTITTEPGVTFTCTVERNFLPVSSGPCGPAASGSAVQSAVRLLVLGTSDSGTVYQVLVDLGNQPDGDFEITIAVTDAAGNTSKGVTVDYILDTVAPGTPSLSSPASPSPVTDPVWRWTADQDTTEICTLTRIDGTVVASSPDCGNSYTAALAGLPDGTYIFSVIAVDAAGNKSKPATSTLVLDRSAPVPPTVVPPRSPYSSTTPAWDITAPRGATVTCTLSRGGVVIYGPATCPANGVFNLAGQPDGIYTLRVTAYDAAHNPSATSVTTYVLDRSAPGTPTLDYGSSSPGSNRAPFWGFTLPSGTTGQCQLLDNGSLVAIRNNCKDAISFNLDGPGTYTVRIYAVDAAGNQSHPLVVTYVLVGGGTGGSGGFGGGSGGSAGGSGGSGGSGGGSVVPSPSDVVSVINQLTGVGKVVNHAVTSAAVDLTPTLPLIRDPLTNDVSHAVQKVVNAVSKVGGGTGFPLLLLVIVLMFLLAQSRIDRRDPKLAYASVAADDNLQFGPPPSRGGFA